MSKGRRRYVGGMPSEREDLSGEEIVLLIEALDALIPFHEDTAYGVTAEERARWAPYSGIRSRLKQAVAMSFYDTARGWLEAGVGARADRADGQAALPPGRASQRRGRHTTQRTRGVCRCHQGAARDSSVPASPALAGHSAPAHRSLELLDSSSNGSRSTPQAEMRRS